MEKLQKSQKFWILLFGVLMVISGILATILAIEMNNVVPEEGSAVDKTM